MTKFMKNFAIIIGVLIISTGIFFLVSEDQAIKEDVFKRSLDLLGEQLFSSIPEGKNRKIIEDKWQDISEKAHKGEVEPEQVERMAVGILNASNLDGEITVNEADNILNLALLEKTDKSDFPEQGSELESTEIVESKEMKTHSQERDHHIKLEKLAENLEAICTFNQNLKESTDDQDRRQLFIQNFRYKFDDGIRLSADISLKKKLKAAKFKKWNEDIKRLDNNHLVEWRHNFALELVEEKELVKLQIDSLRMLIDNQQIQIGNALKIVFGHKNELETLQSLEKLQAWQVLNAKEIDSLILKKLQDLEVRIETK